MHFEQKMISHKMELIHDARVYEANQNIKGVIKR